MAVKEVPPGPFLGASAFAKFTERQSYFNENSALYSTTKRDCYELRHQTATMDLQVF